MRPANLPAASKLNASACPRGSRPVEVRSARPGQPRTVRPIPPAILRRVMEGDLASNRPYVSPPFSRQAIIEAIVLLIVAAFLGYAAAVQL